MDFKVGGRDVIAVEVTGPTLAEGTVPNGLNPGTYSVIAITPEGATATLPDAFEVVEEEQAPAAASGCSSTPTGPTLPAAMLMLAALSVLYLRRRRI